MWVGGGGRELFLSPLSLSPLSLSLSRSPCILRSLTGLGLGHLQWDNSLPKGGCQLYAGCSGGEKKEGRRKGYPISCCLGSVEQAVYVVDRGRKKGSKQGMGGLGERGREEGR